MLFGEASKIIDHLRMTNQKFEENGAGQLKVIQPDGQVIYLSPETTRQVKQAQDLWNEPMRIRDEVTRSYLDEFKDEKLNRGSTLKEIKRVIDNFEDKIKGNPMPEVRNTYKARRESLQRLHNELVEIDNLLRGNVPYTAHMRFGDYVVGVKDKKTGELVHMESLNDPNFFSVAPKLPKRKADRLIREKGIYDKYSSRDYIIYHDQLTYDNIGHFINKNMISEELIQGLIASGLDRTIKLSDRLATGEDAAKMYDEIGDAIKDNKDRLMKYHMSKGFGKFGLKTDNIPGYNQDWGKVYNAFVKISSESLARREQAGDWIEAQSSVFSEKNVPQHVRDYVKNYINYLNEPGNDYGPLRTFNFLWAMGLRPSAAILQLLTIPNQTVAKGTEFGMNPLRGLMSTSNALAHARSLRSNRKETP